MGRKRLSRFLLCFLSFNEDFWILKVKDEQPDEHPNTVRDNNLHESVNSDELHENNQAIPTKLLFQAQNVQNGII